MSWGHDEYMAQVMLKNANTLPPAALWIVRYHSFYAWHREGAYGHLEDDEDREHLHWVREFNKCDLYSKSIAPVDVQALRPYYESLARKYFPEEQLRW
jgi:inositol oxygenase